MIKNVLILGNFSNKLISTLQKCPNLGKLFTAVDYPTNKIPNIEYKTLEELIKKIRILEIDITVTMDKDLIEHGVADFFRKNKMNIVAVNKKWFNLEKSKLVMKQLLNHYSINNPPIIKVPMTFPVVLKTDSSNESKIANNIEELAQKRILLGEKDTVFLENYIEGDVFKFVSLWDGESLYNFTDNFKLTEVQKDRLDLYYTKLNFLMSDEKADFFGFFTSTLIWYQNDWHVIEFIMRLDEDSIPDTNKFLQIIDAGVYCKLNELI